MARRVVMWVTVTSLAGLGVCYVAALVIAYVDPLAAWTTYSTDSASPQFGYGHVLQTINYVQMFLSPTTLLSSAVYIVLLDREVRRGAPHRGFEVQSPQAVKGG